MTHKYTVEGMTCMGCVAGVKKKLEDMPGIVSANVSLENKAATVEMENHVETAAMQDALGTKYTIRDENSHADSGNSMDKTFDLSNVPSIGDSKTEPKTWLETYKPLLIIFVFIAGVSAITAYSNGSIDWMQWMINFMAGFFIVFSFFKFLDLRSFAESYAMYDLLAKRVPAYGFVYPFLELGLGLAYLTGFNPAFTYTATIIIMGFSSIGVIQSVVDKRKIRCACLGSVFNLPMTTVTIIEDLLMVAMAAVMLAML